MGHRTIGIAATIAEAAILLCGGALQAVSAQVAPPTRTSGFTQNRVNEFAAAALTCELALSGVKGARSPGESSLQRDGRIRSCLHAIQTCVASLAPLRHPPVARASDSENLARWQHIPRAVAQLEGNGRALAQALGSSLPQREQEITANLRQAYSTSVALLNLLRDARP